MREVRHIACLIFMLLSSCTRGKNEVIWRGEGGRSRVYLERVTDTLYTLNLTCHADDKHTIWRLPYPVYRFDHGDLWGDETPEIVVGVIKATRFDSIVRKRLFIYRIADGTYIRPLWLGSRVSQPLEDFAVDRSCHPAHIRTIEKERSGAYLVAEYKWRGFGLRFVRYLAREQALKDADDLLHKRDR
ncbi:nuclear receptor-binding factor 2 [Porphyromonas sp.]|uniref:nuclear receptor-binding factor 2 n=1 Tax=Porphyromonas sp. TaxID=1924944 RepID=UPI0026DD25B9|nr:nuclear receptor-binding factor 2 [Porphyromonas sp.]MDO4770647.1 nuclear receptor-binding factor 2 [Porphyromonas sp.]